MTLTEAQSRNLRWLVERGGSGYLDKHSRVVAGGEVSPQGAWPSWLHLIVKGLVVGGDGRISVTDYGMRHVKSSIARASSDA